MSRIDQALERHLRGGRAPLAPPVQKEFTSAWSPDEVGVAAANQPAADAVAVAPEPARPRASNFETMGRREPNGNAMVTLSSAWRERLADGRNADPTLLEQFRQLAGTLFHLQRANNLRSVMVTSATPGDGKTLVSVNLALVLAESYRARVLLVDADLRKPSIPAVLPIADGVGLSDALRAENDAPLALIQLTPTLTLLPAGQPIPNSLEALTSPRMRSIMSEAVERFDWVVLDAGPIGPTTDPRVLTTLVDGAVFVVRAGVTQFDDVQKGIEALGRDHLLGIVLNGVDGASATPYYGTR